MAAFAIFAATDIPSLVVELNGWGANIEQLAAELRGAIVHGAVDIEALRNGMALLEQRTEQIGSVGTRAVNEIETIMTAFRAELILSRGERLSDGEALKAKLRVLVAQVRTKFVEIDTAAAAAAAATAARLEVESAVRTLTATAAAAASTIHSEDDPWFRQRAAASQQRAASVGPTRAAMDADDSNSSQLQAQTGPPGISATPVREWNDSELQAWRSKDWRREKEFHVEMRNWKATNLDMFANPSGFTAWQDRASGLLTSGRQDIRSFLNWAAKCTIPITAAMAQEGARIII